MKHGILIFIILQTTLCISQDTIRFMKEPVLKGKINFFFGTQGDGVYRSNLTLNQIMSFVKDTPGLPNASDYANFSEYNYSDYTRSVMNLTFTKPLSSNQRKEIGGGIIYLRGIHNGVNRYNQYNNSPPIDTTIISSIGVSILQDYLGANFFWKTSSPQFARRLSFYSGISAGITFPVFTQAKSTVTTLEYRSDSTYYPPYNYYVHSFTSNTQVLPAKSSILAMAYIPLGFNIRFLENFGFFLEARPGLALQKYSGARTVVRRQFGFGFGISVPLFH